MVRKGRIGIIPARGGSKRLPMKNIVDFRGKPLIVWTIEAALKSTCFDRVLVSTDDEHIAEVSIKAGVEVPFLRDFGNSDYAPVSEATIAALDQAERHWSTKYSEVIQLMPNCPLRTERHIEAAVKHFCEINSSFQISCFQFGWMNPWWAMRLESGGRPVRIFPEKASSRSQDLERLYCPSGAIWIADRDDLIKAGTFYGPDHRFLPIEWKAAVDIDDSEDLEMALALSKIRDEWRN